MPKTISVVLNDLQYKALARKAGELKVTPSDVIRDGLDLTVDLDPFVLARAKQYSVGLNISLAHVFQNVFLAWEARAEAEKKVWGPGRRILTEFVDPGNLEFTTATKRFDFLVGHYTQDLESQKEAILLRAYQENPKYLREEDRVWLENRQRRFKGLATPEGPKGRLVEPGSPEDSEWTPDVKIPSPQKSKKGQKAKQARKGRSK